MSIYPSFECLGILLTKEGASSEFYHSMEAEFSLGEASKVKYEKHWGKFPNRGGGMTPSHKIPISIRKFFKLGKGGGITSRTTGARGCKF